MGRSHPSATHAVGLLKDCDGLSFDVCRGEAMAVSEAEASSECQMSVLTDDDLWPHLALGHLPRTGLKYPQVADTTDLRGVLPDKIGEEFWQQRARYGRGHVNDQLRRYLNDKIVRCAREAMLVGNSVVQDDPESSLVEVGPDCAITRPVLPLSHCREITDDRP